MVRTRALILALGACGFAAACVNTVSDVTSKQPSVVIESSKSIDAVAACLAEIRIAASPSVVPIEGGKRVVFSNSDGIPLVYDLREANGSTRIELRRQSSIIGQLEATKACA
jgi:hypothetical protein